VLLTITKNSTAAYRFLRRNPTKIPKKGNKQAAALVGYRCILTIKKTVAQHHDLKTEPFFIIKPS
jgi:hypothetical protein